MRETCVDGCHAARENVIQAPSLRLVFHLLTKLLNQILGSAADAQAAPTPRIGPQTLTGLRVNDRQNREVNDHRPWVGAIASDVVAQIGVPGKEKDQIGFPALLRDLKASPGLELLYGGVLRNGQTPRADAVHVNGSRLHDFRGKSRALGFLGKR